MNKFTLRNVRTRLTHWEFWPFAVLYFPVNFYYIWLSIRCRSFFFFTASNPSIDFGGMLGERKSDIFELIPPEYLPEYKLIEQDDLNAALTFAQQIGYPVIAKPDVGERGRLVEKINTPEDLENYVNKCPVPFLIQEFVDLPVELGVFYVRLPNCRSGKVTSLVQKDFLQVKGDGKHSVRALLEKMPRATLQLDFNHPRFQKILSKVPASDERVTVESIGNHCRGTIFLDIGKRVDDDLNQALDQLSSRIKNFCFGRFDLKCRSIDDLKQLKNFKVLELNGAGSEPGHIYQPGSSLWQGYKSIFWHLNVLAQISRLNKHNGHSYWSFSRGMKKLKTIRQYNKLIRNIK